MGKITVFLRSTKFTMQLKSSHFNRSPQAGQAAEGPEIQSANSEAPVFSEWDSRFVTIWEIQRPLPFR